MPDNISQNRTSSTITMSRSELKKSPDTKPTGLGVKINQTAFIHKLYSMLEDHSIEHLISWSPSKDSFLITPGEEFSKVLSLFFKHTNVSSFVRQLNMYGFHKVNDAFHGSTNNSGKTENSKESPEVTQWEFKHGTGAFRRGDLESLRSIKRRASRQTASQRESIPVRAISLSVPSTPPELSMSQPRDAVSRDSATTQLSPTSTFGSQSNITPNLSNGIAEHTPSISNARFHEVEHRVSSVERYLQEMHEIDLRTQQRQRITNDILHRTQQSTCELLTVLGDTADAQIRPHLSKISGDLKQNMTLLAQLDIETASSLYPHAPPPGAEMNLHEANGHFTRQSQTTPPRGFPLTHARPTFFQHYGHLHPKYEQQQQQQQQQQPERHHSVQYDSLNGGVPSPTGVGADEARSPITSGAYSRARGHSLPLGSSPSKASSSLFIPVTLSADQTHTGYGHYAAYHAVPAPTAPSARDQRPASFPVGTFSHGTPTGSDLKISAGYIAARPPVSSESSMAKLDMPIHKAGDISRQVKTSPISEDSASVLLPPIRSSSPQSNKSSLKTLLNPNGEDDPSPKRVKIAE